MFGPRSAVIDHEPIGQGFGSYRTWSRTIGQNRYSFTLVTMPNGEIRYAVRKFNSYVGGPGFDCAWDRVHFFTIKPELECPFCEGAGWNYAGAGENFGTYPCTPCVGTGKLNDN
jgi:hypothetical protein